MRIRLATPALFLASVAMLGCRSHDRPQAPPASEKARSESTVRREARSAAEVAEEVRQAPDALAEAAALEKLRTWAADNGYTYVVRATGTRSATPIPNPAGQAAPVNVHVDIYRAERVVHSFDFVPKDNRNLTIIAKGI